MRSPSHHHYQSSLRHSFASAPLLIIVLSTLCSARPKKDVLHFANGDRLTCEIIKLEKGYLYVKLEYADGTVPMDWSKIVSVESPQSFVVADQAGKRYTGALQNASVEKTPPEEELRVEIGGPPPVKSSRARRSWRSNGQTRVSGRTCTAVSMPG